jgi:hypothetical protein
MYSMASWREPLSTTYPCSFRVRIYLALSPRISLGRLSWILRLTTVHWSPMWMFVIFCAAFGLKPLLAASASSVCSFARKSARLRNAGLLWRVLPGRGLHLQVCSTYGLVITMCRITSRTRLSSTTRVKVSRFQKSSKAWMKPRTQAGVSQAEG